MKNKRRIGTYYEDAAADDLIRHGYRIRERNYRCKFGEIDIIAQKDGYLIFIEVKYRSTAGWGTPQEAVDAKKQRRISNAASWYLYSHHYPADTPVRFDVAALSGQSISLIENAFPYCGSFSG